MSGVEEHHIPITAEEIAHVFEEEEAPVDLSPYSVEDWVTLAVFWFMALCVFLQFFTRYVLNNSLAWTEEIATNYLPDGAARVLSTLVDLIRILFFAYACWLLWRYVAIVAQERMVTVNLPRSVVFYSVFAAFVLMLLRAIQVAWANWRRGYSILERPGAFDNIGE